MKKATITMPEHLLRKYLSNFGNKLIKDFMSTRHKELTRVADVLREMTVQKPTIH